MLHSVHAYLLLKNRLYDDDNKKRNRYKIDKLAWVVFLALLKQRRIDSLSLPEYMWSVRSDVLSFMHSSLRLSTFPCLISAALQWSCLTPQNKLCARLKYHILRGGRDYWNVASCRHSEETLIYRFVLSAERPECFIWLSSVSPSANCEGGRWLKRRGIEVFNLQVFISDSAWVRMIVKSC